MIGAYLNATAIHTPTASDLSTGALSKGDPRELRCQVVDDNRVRSGQPGRELTEGIFSVVIVELNECILEGDFIEVCSVRGVSVERKKRVVRSVNVVGGFSASHKEILI